VKKLARFYSQDAIKVLASIMSDAEAPTSSRVSAAGELLDRGFGRPLQQVEVGSPGAFSEMSDNEIDAFIASRAGAYISSHSTALN